MHAYQADDGARFETLGADTSSTVGITVTTSGSANTKGSWADIGTATFDYESIAVQVSGSSTVYLVDVGIGDGAGNYWVLVQDLHYRSKSANELTVAYSVPVHVPAGAVVACRAQSAAASSQSIQVVIVGCSRGIGGAPGFSRCVALGADTTTSRGTSIDPGGTANTEGSWVQLTASTAVDIVALFAVFGAAGDVARTNAAGALCDIGVGGGGSEAVVVPNQCLWWASTIDNANVVTSGLHPVQIPAGSRVAARGQCNDNTAGDRTWDMVVYGLAA